MNKETAIKIHILHCGTISLPENMAYLSGRLSGKRADFPVSVYLIEHPAHGRILVETGLSKAYLDKIPARLKRFYAPGIEDGQSAAEQLRAMGIEPGDIDLLIITHNDADHTCALGDFAGKAKRIIMAEHEYFWSCRTVYRLRQAWDTYMPYIDMIEKPHYYGCAPGPIGRGFDVFGDDSILCIACPGHTEGQFAVMVNRPPSGRFLNAGDGSFGGPFAILASDVAFSQKNIDDLVPPGFGFDRERQINALKWLKEMKANPSCRGIFCSHDPDVEPQTVIL